MEAQLSFHTKASLGQGRPLKQFGTRNLEIIIGDNLMKKSILALVLVSALGLGAVTSVFAEDPVPGQTTAVAGTNAATTAPTTAADTQAQRDAKMAEHIEKRVSHMKESLSLTDDQATQLKVVLTEQHTKREALHTETDTRITGILTPEQATKLKSLQGGHGGFGMEGGHDGKGRHGGGHHRGWHGGWGDKPAE